MIESTADFTLIFGCVRPPRGTPPGRSQIPLVQRFSLCLVSEPHCTRRSFFTVWSVLKVAPLCLPKSAQTGAVLRATAQSLDNAQLHRPRVDKTDTDYAEHFLSRNWNMAQPTPLPLWITRISMESNQQFRLCRWTLSAWVRKEPISKFNSQWSYTSLRPALPVAENNANWKKSGVLNLADVFGTSRSPPIRLDIQRRPCSSLNL